MKNIYFLTSCFCGLLCCGLLGDRLEAANEAALKADATVCSKQNLMTFFPEPVVKAVLNKRQLPQDEVDAIAKELSQKDQEIVKIVETKASSMEPNPFKDPSQRDAAHQVFKEALFEVFANTMKAHGIKDENQIEAILEEIRATKGKLFVECILKETPAAK